MAKKESRRLIKVRVKKSQEGQKVPRGSKRKNRQGQKVEVKKSREGQKDSRMEKINEKKKRIVGKN